ncbi:MAG: hypothetical protein JF598_09410, partial [Streptomyces sp.]|nr:hypothetical protein [Streptomyces sp.]
MSPEDVGTADGREGTGDGGAGPVVVGRDGADLPVWVTRSPAAKGALPAVVLVHGGPWVRGSVWGW